MTSPGPPGRPFPPSLPPRGRGIGMETTQLDSEGFGWKVCATTQLGEECSRRLPELSIMDAGRETHPPQGWLAKHTGQNYASSGSPALPAGSQPRQEGAEAGRGPTPSRLGTWTQQGCHTARNCPFFAPLSCFRVKCFLHTKPIGLKDAANHLCN